MISDYIGREDQEQREREMAARFGCLGSADLDTMDVKPFVVIESPYMGNIARNVAYARACVRDSILRGEAPFASHLLYTQPGVLRDEVHEERELGMGLGWHVMRRANLVAVYIDLGWSSGMTRGKAAAIEAGVKWETRHLPMDIVEPILRIEQPVKEGWPEKYHGA